jgi:hypothetical protein
VRSEIPKKVSLISQAILIDIKKGVRSEIPKEVNLVSQAALNPTRAPQMRI